MNNQTLGAARILYVHIWRYKLQRANLCCICETCICMSQLGWLHVMVKAGTKAVNYSDMFFIWCSYLLFNELMPASTSWPNLPIF